MDWGRERAKLSNQEVAEQVLQIYTKALQDTTALKGILSEFSVLNYFGKVYYGKEAISSHLISNLHGSTYELSSLTVSDEASTIQWNSADKAKEKLEEEDLGVSLISLPKVAFPSLTFSAPLRSFSQPRKRNASQVLVEDSNENSKVQKRESNGKQSTTVKQADNEHQSFHVSPHIIQSKFSRNSRYLSTYGTIQYPKRVVPTMEPKRIKQQTLLTQRDRFCQLCIVFECEEQVLRVTDCKIWTIQYSFSSRITPRNLLEAFNEVEED